MVLRLKAFWFHLSASALLLSVFCCLVFFFWYTPYPLLSLQGGVKILLLMILIDVVLGPSLTLLIFKSEKSHRMLILDILAIIILQISAFCYGAWLLYSERPIFLALVVDRFEVVRAPDINVEAIDKSILTLADVNGAQWVSVEIPNKPNFQQLLSHLIDQQDMALKPQYYRPLQSVKLDELAKNALPTQEIKANEQIHNWLQSHQLRPEKVLLFPVNGRLKQGTAVLSADTGLPLGLIAE